jgi:hypothetical protein
MNIKLALTSAKWSCLKATSLLPLEPSPRFLSDIGVWMRSLSSGLEVSLLAEVAANTDFTGLVHLFERAATRERYELKCSVISIH